MLSIKQFFLGPRIRIALSLLLFFCVVSGLMFFGFSLKEENPAILFLCWIFSGCACIFLFTWMIGDLFFPSLENTKDRIAVEISCMERFHQNFEKMWQDFLEKKKHKAYEFTGAMNETTLLHESFCSHLKEVVIQLERVLEFLQDQNAKTQKTSSALAEMSTSIKSVSSQAEACVDTSKSSEEDAKKGGEVVSQIIRHMNKITQTVSKSAVVIQELGKSAETIVDIISVIEDIADQTNLLALNAAIEAARAGQQGRGFGVVADQIRSLAEKTTHATKEIASTLSSIQEKTARAVESMDEGIKEIDKGAGFAVQAGVSLRKIVAGAKKVTEMISNIASSTEKQSKTATLSLNLVTEISQGVESTCQGGKTASTSIIDIENKRKKLYDLMIAFLKLWTENILDQEIVSLGIANNKEIFFHTQRLQKIHDELKKSLIDECYSRNNFNKN